MTYVIKDTASGCYFSGRFSDMGWYNRDIGRARMFVQHRKAQASVNAGGHHVAYPGGRNLVVVKVHITEEVDQ